MNPIRLLSKMAPKTINYNSAGGGTSIDAIDWRTAAHSLVGLSKDANNWALYRFVGQDEKLKSVYRSLSMSISLFIKINRFKIKPHTLDGLIRAAVHEHTKPMTVCKACNGAKVIINAQKQVVECESCYGRGVKVISKRERCAVIGINHKSYSDTHDSVSKELLRIIGSWEQAIIKNVNEKMGDAA